MMGDSQKSNLSNLSSNVARLNLVQLFAQNPRNSQLRKLIVDLEVCSYSIRFI